MNHLPTITLHGTHPQQLFDGWMKVMDALRNVQSAMRDLEFNGRDYDGNFPQAREELAAHGRNVIDFKDACEAVLIHIQDTRGNR